MGFSTVSAITNAYNSGSCWQGYYYKATAPSLGANVWTDLSNATGTPVYQPYIGSPLEATAAIGTNNSYMFTGPTPPAGQQKYLLNWSIGGYGGGASGAAFILYDLLLYYPFVDGTNITEQFFDNAVTLPRYTSGEGVYPVFISQTPGSIGAVTCDLNYTNSKDVAGRTLKMGVGNGVTIGRIMNLANNTTSASTPFIQIQNGDTGVKSIESVTFNSSVGGFVTVALVKPIAQISHQEQGTLIEKNYIREGFVLPEIINGAALQIMFNQQSGAGSMGTITSYFETVWG
jgi:hypothetical protein